jgi:hypothetical protein
MCWTEVVVRASLSMRGRPRGWTRGRDWKCEGEVGPPHPPAGGEEEGDVGGGGYDDDDEKGAEEE